VPEVGPMLAGPVPRVRGPTLTAAAPATHITLLGPSRKVAVGCVPAFAHPSACVNTRRGSSFAPKTKPRSASASASIAPRRKQSTARVEAGEEVESRTSHGASQPPCTLSTRAAQRDRDEGDGSQCPTKCKAVFLADGRRLSMSRSGMRGSKPFPIGGSARPTVGSYVRPL